MNEIIGLENHKLLYGYVEKVEKFINENDDEDAKVNLRKCAECIVNEYLKEFPFCVGNSLFESIKSLKENKIISWKENNLLHALRETGNDGGAHVKIEFSDDYNDQKYENELEKVIALHNRLLDYLPEFIERFPAPSTKPVPNYENKCEKSILNTSLDEIQPLKLGDGWRDRIGFTEMFYFDRKCESFLHYTTFNDWIWLVRLAKKGILLRTIDHKEYLDLRVVVEYYLKIYNDHANNKKLWFDVSDDYECWSHMDGIKHIQLPDIIHKYFPGGSFTYEEGKGIVWDEKYEESGENQIRILTDANAEKTIVAEDCIQATNAYNHWKEEKEREERERAERIRYEKEQEKKAFEERVKQRREEQENAKKNMGKKIVKYIILLYIVVFALGMLMWILNYLAQAKIGIAILLIVIVVRAYLIHKKRDKNK